MLIVVPDQSTLFTETFSFFSLHQEGIVTTKVKEKMTVPNTVDKFSPIIGTAQNVRPISQNCTTNSNNKVTNTPNEIN